MQHRAADRVVFGRVGVQQVGRRATQHGDETLMALLRAAVTNPAAADRMREIFASQLGPAVLAVAPVTTMDRATVIDWLALTLQRYFTG